MGNVYDIGRIKAHFLFFQESFQESFDSPTGLRDVSFPLAQLSASVVSRVIPSAGGDAQSSGSIDCLDVNRVVRTRRMRIRRAVADYVLTADVSRNCSRNRLPFVEIGGEERRASSLLGEATQGLPITFISPLVLFECDDVEDRSVLRLQLAQNLLERSLARIVPPVGHNQQSLFLRRGNVVQVIDGTDKSVVERHTSRGDPADSRGFK
jgi:hypothetical protein